MNSIKKIEQLLNAPSFKDDLIWVAENGATDEELQVVEQKLGRGFSEQHKNILRRWNGVGWTVLNICGTRDGYGNISIEAIQNEDFTTPAGMIIIAGSITSFLYGEDATGKIWLLDSTDLSSEQIAEDIDDLLCRAIFGEDADKWISPRFKDELRKAGIIA